MKFYTMLFWLISLPAVFSEKLRYSENCPNNGVFNEQLNKCYNFHQTPACFKEAEEICQSLSGHLASVAQTFENNLINHYAGIAFSNTNTTDYWIGGSNSANEKYWTWTDYSKWQFSNWMPGEPRSDRHCSNVDLKSALWKADDCASFKSFVCITPPIPPTPTCPPPVQSCTQRPSKSYCDSEWTYFEQSDSCYKIGYYKDFYQAEADCVNQGAHLTSIHSKVEDLFVNNFAKVGQNMTYDCQYTWIGLYQNDCNWVWTDNSGTEYLNWAEGEPNKVNAKCVETVTDRRDYKPQFNQNWDNVECDLIMRNYVCKKRAYHS